MVSDYGGYVNEDLFCVCTFGLQSFVLAFHVYNVLPSEFAFYGVNDDGLKIDDFSICVLVNDEI